MKQAHDWDTLSPSRSGWVTRAVLASPSPAYAAIMASAMRGAEANHRAENLVYGGCTGAAGYTTGGFIPVTGGRAIVP